MANLAAMEAPGIVLRQMEDIRTSAKEGETDDVASLEIPDWSPPATAHDPTGYNILVRQFGNAASATKQIDSKVVTLDDHRTTQWWL